MPKKKKKNIVLFTGKIFGHMHDAIIEYQKRAKKDFRIALICDSKKKLPINTKKILDKLDLIISCDTSSMISIQKALTPYQKELLAITCRGEDQIPLLSRVIPHVPYLKTSGVESLLWSSNKLQMRRRLFYHDKTITPGYKVALDSTEQTITSIEKAIKYPMVVKPVGLAASRLVSICYHHEEFEKTLKSTFKKLKRIYKESNGVWEPKILVEEFLEGEMYSVDAYVNDRGKVQFCPMVHVKTGKQIGFDDFFGYRQMTPTLLKKNSIAEAEGVATEAIHALGMKNTSAHVELMRVEGGWKIIEVGARVGGFRHMMYEFSFGINHTINDIRIRIPERIVIPKKIRGYTAAMKFFAKKEGKLTKLTGIKKAQELESFKKIYINKKIGDKCTYAKHGGSSVFNIVLFNKERSRLLADIRRLEQMTKIQTK